VGQSEEITGDLDLTRDQVPAQVGAETQGEVGDDGGSDADADSASPAD
jgi:hypothetical protein